MSILLLIFFFQNFPTFVVAQKSSKKGLEMLAPHDPNTGQNVLVALFGDFVHYLFGIRQ